MSYRITTSIASASSRLKGQMWIIIVLVLIQLVSIEQCHGFNLDVNNSLSFESPENGSYYGYTVAMLKRSTNTKW